MVKETPQFQDASMTTPELFNLDPVAITQKILDEFGIPKEEFSYRELMESSEGVDWKGEAQ
jgi:hypothetical protein